jgi:aspartate-semialdehyde dehydrogenase
VQKSGQGRENQTQRDATAERIPAMYGHSKIVQITYTKDSVKEEWVVTHLDNWQEGWSVKRRG